ncbi:MAG: OpgC domain-containing protein [Candidatus Competibacteraceae bacterium]
MRRLAWRRVGQIYRHHVLTLLFCFVVIGQLMGHQKPFFNMIHTYLEQPTASAISALLLLYQPPLLDILPMYLVFLLLTPMILTTAARSGWLPIVAGSSLLWLASQFGLKEWLVGLIERDWLVIDLGAFNLLSWQLLWIGGLLLGHSLQNNPVQLDNLLDRFPRSLVLGLALFFFCWRWPWIPVSIDLGNQYWLLSKWQLGPLRLLNFAVLVYLVLWLSPYINKILGYFKPLALLGRHMLPLFSMHVCISLLAVGFVEIFALTDPWCYLILSLHLGLIIGMSLWLDQRSETPPGNTATPPLYN